MRTCDAFSQPSPHAQVLGKEKKNKLKEKQAKGQYKGINKRYAWPVKFQSILENMPCLTKL